MKQSKLIADIFCVLTYRFGKETVDVDCDGTFYYYKWLGFYINSGPSIMRFSGNGMYATYFSGYDLHPAAQTLDKSFRFVDKMKEKIKRIKRASKLFFGVKIYTKEMIIAAWKISATRGYSL